MIRSFLTIALIFAGLLCVASYKLGTRQGQSDSLQAVMQRLSAIEARQHQMEGGYLNDTPRPELARRLGYKTRSDSQSFAPAEINRHQVSPAEASNTLQQKYLQLQKSFESEPINAQWAGTARQQVDDVLSDIVAEGVAAPRSAQTDCRSRSCMIDVDLSNSAEADALSQSLLTEISAELPVTTFIQVPSADGARIELHVFATQHKKSG